LTINHVVFDFDNAQSIHLQYPHPEVIQAYVT